VIAVKAVPGAARDQIAGVLALPGGPRLKVRVSAPAESGRANAAITRLLAAALGVPDHAVRVVAGTTSPLKIVRADGIDAIAARTRLGVPAGEPPPGTMPG
jgi:hypothetical protein